MDHKVRKAMEYVRTVTDFEPKVALILGSGLGNYAGQLDVLCEIPYTEIPGFPVSTVEGHDGRFIFGTVGAVPVVCMKGRVHFYEGYEMEQVVMPTRLMAAMGAKILFLTNASGGLLPEHYAGALSLITDHVSLFVKNPLIGPNDDEEGPRFPDMTEVYSKELSDEVRKAAKDEGIDLTEGVYAQLTGPSFETPAEIRLLKQLGIGMVGMSTVIEAIVARHIGMQVCGVSLVSNLAAGLSGKALSHEEVQESGRLAEEKFTRLVTSSILRFGKLD